MKTKLIAMLFASAALLNASAGVQAQPESTMSISNKDKTIALLTSIETGDQQAVGYINANQYVQHNLAVADGLAGFGELLQALPKGSAKVNVVRAFEDGDYVFTHTEYDFFGPKIGFDLFRFERGKIVEHWDNLTVRSAQLNPSGHSQTDGITEINDRHKTEVNKALIADFVETVLIKGDYHKMADFFDGDNYVQHNSAIADGLSGLTHAIEVMAEQGITMKYDKNHTVLGEGNFVLSISEGRFAGEPTAYYDLFRVENGKIAEHWDVMETIIPKEQWKNSNGKFGNL